MAYSKVERQTWDDERFRPWPIETRLAWLYLLTCKYQNRIGCFVLDPMYMAADVRITLEQALAALETFQAEDRVMFDAATRLILIVNHFRHNHPENPNVARKAADDVREIPFAEPFLKGLLKGCLKYTKQTTDKGEPFCSVIADAIRQRLDNRGNGNGLNTSETVSKGLGQHFRIPEPEPELEPTDTLHKTRGSAGAVPARLREWLGDGLAQAADRFLASANHSATALDGIAGMYLPGGTNPQAWSGTSEADRPTMLATALDRIAAEGQPYRSNFFASILKRVIDEHSGNRKPNGRSNPGQARSEAPRGRTPTVGNQASRRKQGFGGVVPD